MPKLPFMQFYPMDWIRDTRELQDDEKSLWIDILCFMWFKDRRGILTGHWSDLARMLGKERGEFETTIHALKRKGTLDIILHDETSGDGQVTLKNRRMEREQNAYEMNTLRQARWRSRRKSDALVTDKTSDIRRQTLKDKDIPPLPPKGGRMPFSPENLFSVWNEKAHVNLPRVLELTEARRNKARARIKERPEAAAWEELIAKINRSLFLTGQVESNGRKPFTASFDWILEPKNMVKILEGNYDDKKEAPAWDQVNLSTLKKS